MDHQLIRQIYAAGARAARFEELLCSWEEKIVSTGSLGEPGVLVRPEIVAHIRQAVAVFDDLEGDPASAGEPAADPWRAGPYPVMLCDERGVIHDANAPARSRYGAAHIGELPFDGEVVEAIQRAAARLVKPSATTSAVIPARNIDRHQPTVLSVQPQRSTEQGRAGLVRLVSNELHWPDGLNDLLQSTFGLSAAECEVMRLMTEGASVSKAAELRGSSVPTVRVQLRSIYGKTGVRSQPELLRLAISFVSLSDLRVADAPAGAAAASGAPIHPRPEERHLFTLADGRQLDYADLGHPGGHAVLYLHDEYYGDAWSAEAIRYATATRLRIIAPARPYFGRSDGYPAGVDAAEQFAQDVEALLARLGIDRFVVLARRTGFRFAVEVAHHLAGRVAGIVALSPALPARSTDDYRQMTRLARFISFTIFENPALLDLVCRAGIRYFRQMGPRKLAGLLNKGCREDLALLDDPGCWKLVEAGMRFSSTHGYQAYLHDVRHDPAHAWYRTMQCPVHIHCLIGAHDPHDRARRARRCADAGAALSVSEVSGAGQLFFLSHPATVLNEVTAVLTNRAGDVAVRV